MAITNLLEALFAKMEEVSNLQKSEHQISFEEIKMKEEFDRFEKKIKGEDNNESNRYCPQNR